MLSRGGLRSILPPGFTCSVSFGVLGSALGLGSPLGMLLLRMFFFRSAPLSISVVAQEISRYASFYSYMGGGTILVFGFFGYFMGRQVDADQVENEMLRRRIEELRIYSIKDSLTEAFSHAYMMEALKLEMDATRRSKKPLTIAMLDVDNFKDINDSFGHLFGDRVLSTLAQVIRENVRANDLLCRYGGDEFLIIMTGIEGEEAWTIAERVLRAVAESKPTAPVSWVGREPKGFRITISMGLATFDGLDSMTAMEFLAEADEKLYQAKREGRNRIC